jgi:hypothetical protein
MKIAQVSKEQNFILGIALLVTASFVTPAFADYSYLIDLNTHTATRLGNLGGSETVATALNDAAQVVVIPPRQMVPSMHSLPASTAPE